MRIGKLRLVWLPVVPIIAVAVVGTITPARSECLSPSSAAGATSTTVYRCSEDNAADAPSPLIIDPDKTTEVERGSADLPWFEPKPTKTEDPIKTSKSPPEKQAPLEKKEDVAKIAPPAAEAVESQPVDKDVPPVEAVKTKEPETEPPKAEEPETEPPKIEKAKPKPALAKPIKVKVAKAKRTKSKLARKKLAKTKTAKAQTPQQQPVKTEPAKSDDKVVVWTRKDMSLGNRIVNWLGF